MGRTIGHWVLEPAPIGQGSFAIVWRARHSSTGQHAAVKEINTDKLNPKLKESLASEISVLERTRHRNIVGLLDLIKEEGRIFLVLEFCGGGDLGHYLRRYGRVSEATAWYLLHQLAEGLKMLRANNLIHRDLKPQNLLLSDNSRQPVLKIADFGFARNLQPQGLAETLCGSPLYMAPEILQFTKYDAKADLWSVGTILFELLTGKPPFNGANHLQLLQNIERGNGGVLPEPVAAALSPACKQLLHQLLRRNPVERIGFPEFFSHPFLASAPPAPMLQHPSPKGSSTPPPTSPDQQGTPTAAHRGGQQQGGVARRGTPPLGTPVGAVGDEIQSPASATGRPAQTQGGVWGGVLGPRPVHAVGPVMGVDEATGIVVRHVTQHSPPPRFPTPPLSQFGAEQGSGPGQGQQQPAQAAPDATARTISRSLAFPESGGDGSGQHGYTEVDLGPSPAPTPPPGPHPLDAQPGSHRAGAAAGGHSSREAEEQEDDFVMVASSGSEGGVAGHERGSASRAGGSAASVAATPSNTQGQGQGQAASLLRQVSKGRGMAWEALGRLGPALLQPRLMAAATQQLKGVVTGMSMSQSTNVAAARPGAAAPSWAQRQHGQGVQQQQPAASAAGQQPKGSTVASSASSASAAAAAAGSKGSSQSGPASAGAAGTATTQAAKQGSPADLQWIASLAQLPEHLDTVDLLQRVLHILLDTGRQRWEGAVAAAEAAAEAAAAEAAATAASQVSAGQTGGSGPGGRSSMGGAPAGAPAPSVSSSPSAGSKAQKVKGDPAGAAMLAAASVAAAREIEPAAAELLAIHLFCSRLLDAALSAGGVAASAHPHASAMLATHARTLLAASTGHVAYAMSRLPAGTQLPRGLDTVYTAALQCCRAGASEELMGSHHASVQQYAKAADLLLFLLTDVPTAQAAKPRLCAGDAARVHKFYAAVKMRQRANLVVLNAS